MSNRPGARGPRMPSQRPQARPPVLLDAIPKPGGGTRWLARLTPEDEAAYARAVARVTARVEGALGTEVLANRATRRGDALALMPWREARRRWRAAVARAMKAPERPAFAVADVADCYSTITADAVGLALSRLGTPRWHVQAVTDVLRDLQERGVRGLPVGPDPSAVLANAVLHHVDRALRQEGVRHLRWVDDVVVIGAAPARSIRGLRAFEASLRELGLRVNETKTRPLDDPRDLLLGRGVSPARVPAGVPSGVPGDVRGVG